MKTIILLAGLVLLVVFISGCTMPSNVIEPTFIANASHGMNMTLSPGDVILVGRAGYMKNVFNNDTNANDTYKVQICEECGIDNDCLQNNLNRLAAHNETSWLNMTKADLKYFYVFAITHDEVKAQQQSNETFSDAYDRILNQKCNDKDYWAGIAVP